jgi:hypothetical protein
MDKLYKIEHKEQRGIRREDFIWQKERNVKKAIKQESEERDIL